MWLSWTMRFMEISLFAPITALRKTYKRACKGTWSVFWIYKKSGLSMFALEFAWKALLICHYSLLFHLFCMASLRRNVAHWEAAQRRSLFNSEIQVMLMCRFSRKREASLKEINVMKFGGNSFRDFLCWFCIKDSYFCSSPVVRKKSC